MTFTTAAFDRSSSWSFGASSYKATPKARPSSPMQLRTAVLTAALVTQTRLPMFNRQQNECRRHCLDRSAPPEFGWRWSAAEQRGPFGPVSLQNLRPYYEPLRPCAPHRYSRPLGFSQLDFLPLHRNDRFSRYESLMRTRAVYMPDAARAGSGYPPNLSQGFGVPLVSTSPDSYDISSTVCLRSPFRIIPAGISSRLFRNAHHDRSLRSQLAGV